MRGRDWLWCFIGMLTAALLPLGVSTTVLVVLAGVAVLFRLLAPTDELDVTLRPDERLVIRWDAGEGRWTIEERALGDPGESFEYWDAYPDTPAFPMVVASVPDMIPTFPSVQLTQEPPEPVVGDTKTQDSSDEEDAM